MGTIKKGILGGFSGKVGNIIGANWKGIDYMRIMPASVANPKTPAQVDQRSKFVTVLKFLQSVTDFLRIGYKNYAVKKTQFNAAMSELLKNAITGEYPNFQIDYSAVVLSKGSLPNVLNPQATSDTPGEVVATWTDNTENGDAISEDTAMIVVHNPQLKESVFITSGGQTRASETQTIAVPSSYNGQDVEVYISMIDPNGNKLSNSQHLGTVTVASA